MQNTEGKDNVVIQEVSDKSMTVNVNGEMHTIHNQLAELKELLKTQNVSNITYADKIYNIEHINEANFGVMTSNKVFNGVLTKELIYILKEKEKPKNFLGKLRPEHKDNWHSVRQLLNEAQVTLADTFVWVIGWELRRLFAIGNEVEDIEKKVDKYIKHCIITCRISVQLINYLFISNLWDEKRKKSKVNADADKEPIRDFFTSQRKPLLSDLHKLFQKLIEIYKSNKLEYPINKDDFGDINEFLKSDSKFNQACADLESLETLDILREPYGLGHCHTAELALTTVLSSFIFLANCHLVTMKKIEYEESRNLAGRYIKDLNILENKEEKSFRRRLIYDDSPGMTYSVFLKNKDKSINLFPFLLDYNALIDADGFQLFFYRLWDRKTGLHYFSIESDDEKIIDYRDAKAESVVKIKDEEQKNDLQKKIRLNLVTEQFEKAMNTILDTEISFKSEENVEDEDDVDLNEF
jgi:DNA-directed RNA polymerase subunit L